MAVSATLNTPTTLVKNQVLSIKGDAQEIACYNDSTLSERHYRTIPNDGSDISEIKWANLTSVALPDGDYAVAVSMFEYVYIGEPESKGFGAIFMKAANDKTKITDNQNRQYYIQPDTVVVNGPRIYFRKIVWCKASDLVLGSVAQQKAMTDAEKAAADKAFNDALAKHPVTGNNGNGGLKTWLIVSGILLIFIGGIWWLIASLKKKKAKDTTASIVSSQPNVNIIRVPKGS